MLSVVIPVYNVAPYLDKCISSVVNQTYRDLEIILVNDGSTDNSGEICESWAGKDSRIRYFQKENEGSGKTRNLGIRHATGEYIAFLDSDDWWEPDYAEQMLPYAEGCEVVICDMNYIDVDEDGRDHIHVSKIRMPDRVPQRTEDNPDYINCARTFLCGKIFWRSLFVENDIEQPTMPINDIPIVTLLVAKSTCLCRVGKPLYNYLRGRAGNTVTSPNSLKSFGDALVLMKENFERHGLLEPYGQAMKKMYYSQFRFAMKKAVDQKKKGLITKEQYKDVFGHLDGIISGFWPDYPRLEGKKFWASSDEDVNQAIGYVTIEDCLEEDIADCDYAVCVKEEQFEDKLETLTVVRIEKNSALEGEDLWWDLADQLLFRL